MFSSYRLAADSGLSIAVIICFSLNSYLLIRELQQIKNGRARYQTPFLKWLCIGTLVIGLLHPVLDILSLILFHSKQWTLCSVTVITTDTMGGLQALCIVSYQLSRLYILFSDKDGLNGYPKWMFIVLSIVIVIDLLLYILVSFLSDFECGSSDQSLQRGAALLNAIYILMEIMVLSLFLFKINNLTKHRDIKSPKKKKTEMIKQRVWMNVERVTVLTSFYLVVTLIQNTVQGIGALLHGGSFKDISIDLYPFRTTAISLAIYLMQSHNGESYSGFIRILLCLKIYICCCFCCRDILKQQMDFFHDDAVKGDLELRLLESTTTQKYTAYGQFSLDEPPESLKQ